MSLAMLDRELSSLAFCWRLERRDGAGLALTSHDRPLMIDGMKFEPAPGITPAAIRATMGLEANMSEVHGSLSSEAITAADVAAGRWDGAALRLSAVDWEAPGGEALTLLQGELGQVALKGGAFEVDLLGIAARLERPICPYTSPDCRAELGDPDCRVDMAGRRLRAVVTSVSGHLVEVDQPVDERFRFGSIRFLAGPANGERRAILAATDHQLSLRSAPSGVVETGTPVELIEGCDKRLATCSGRFGNAVNFRGEPHLPGNDLLTRYPGS
jgi:uncharacterized phage protein (TIGR02218 family)